jgi:Beta-ketoacyl synthase, N-terminal domain
MTNAYIHSIGVAAPGMPNWEHASKILSGEIDYQFFELDKYKPELLPPNERRRATEMVRLAFRICEEAASRSSIQMSECASVFASSDGDYFIIDQICRTLCTAEKMVSPTQFHNSVHNSAAGYWSIAAQSRLASTSISALDDSFIVGLAEAMSFCQQEQQPVLFAAYDISPPEPLLEKRKVLHDFGIAFLLTPTPDSKTLAKLDISTTSQTIETQSNPQLAFLRETNPAARSLPLLENLSLKKTADIFFNIDSGSTYKVRLESC